MRKRFRTALDGEPGGHLMGLFVAFTFGSSYPVAKPVLALIDPYTFAATRYVLASAVLLTLLWLSAGPRLPARGDWWQLILVGLLGYTVFQGIWGVALSLTSASKAVILVATTPVFSALVDRLCGARLSAWGWLGIAFAFTGVFVVVNNSLVQLTVGDGSLLGDLLFVGIAALWAVYGALSRPLVVRLGALRTTTWAAAFGTLGLLPLGWLGASNIDWQALNTSIVLATIYSGVVVGCFGLVAWGAGLARLGLTRISLYLYVSPVIGVSLSVALLGEWLSLVQAGGGIAVIAGVALTQLLGRPASTRHV